MLRFFASQAVDVLRHLPGELGAPRRCEGAVRIYKNTSTSRAAELLGLSRFALQRKVEKYELDARGRPAAGEADRPADSGPATP